MQIYPLRELLLRHASPQTFPVNVRAALLYPRPLFSYEAAHTKSSPVSPRFVNDTRLVKRVCSFSLRSKPSTLNPFNTTR